jgi:hypothetical protein
MRSMTIVFLAAAAMAATSGCGRKTTDEFAPAIDDSLSLVVVNRLGVYATVYWQYDGWGRRELDRIEPGRDRTYRVEWQSIPLRMAIRYGTRTVRTTEWLTPLPGDSLELLLQYPRVPQLRILPRLPSNPATRRAAPSGTQ